MKPETLSKIQALCIWMKIDGFGKDDFRERFKYKNMNTTGDMGTNEESLYSPISECKLSVKDEVYIYVCQNFHGSWNWLRCRFPKCNVSGSGLFIFCPDHRNP